MNDTNLRSIIKALSWRLTGTVDTFIVSFFVTGELLIAGSIASIEVLTKIVLFWIHERVWDKVKWGRFIKPTTHPVGFDWRKPTVQMLGRWQPWHAGHRWLIDQQLNQGKKVCIAIRDMQPDEKNPYSAIQVMMNITNELMDLVEQGMIRIMIIPDIESINFGRGVGYDVIEHIPPAEIGEISATKIREANGK